jgi:hypothetical protein
MFFRVFTTEHMDAVRAEMERQKARATAETVNHGLTMMLDKDGEVVIEKADMVTIVGHDPKVEAEIVERTMLESDRYGWVPLSCHASFSEFQNTSLEPDDGGFTLVFRFHPGHLEDVDFKEVP